MSDIQTLVELQKIDADALRAKKELDALPEAKQIMECRAKRKEIKGKQDQVIELADDVQKKIAKLSAEETKVIEKIKELQDELESTSDYRVTQKVTRDMEGQVKRQASISDEQTELMEREIKVDKLADQVADMLQRLDHKEEHLTADFKKKGGALKQQIDGLSKQHDGLIAKLPDALARRYEKLRGEKGGVALARLEGNHCSVCSTTVTAGQLEKLKKGPALSECPNCQRIMIVRDEEED